MNKNTTTVIFILVIVAVLAVLGWYYFSAQKVAVETPIVTESSQATTTPETKTYRNEEWGFEFEYPEGWTFHENTFYSPASKFNLVGASPEENNVPNPIIPPLLVNIVTPTFADNAIVNIKKLGATETNIIIDGINGIKYEYKVGAQEEILVDLLLEKYRLELSAIRGYEDVFSQILVSFKFLK
jgi:heme/copper-type cytochrome/quinol oxidase subunit 2